MRSRGPSSSRIHALGADDATYVAPVTFVMASVRYSSGSTVASPLIVTEKFTHVVPAGMVTEPLPAGKSEPTVAVPLTAAQLKVTGVPEGSSSSAENESVFVPAFPSKVESPKKSSSRSASSSRIPPPGGEDATYVAPVTLVMEIVKYSSGSANVSPLIVTKKLVDPYPAGMVSEPLPAT